VSEEIAKTDSDTLLKLATGDTSKLNNSQKIDLIVQVCRIAGIDPRLSPFEFIKFQGREQLYAKKNATDQLVQVHGIKLVIKEQKTEHGIRAVTVHAETKDGRSTEDIGCVNLEGLKGDALANAMMKAVTKAKRRTVLSICGLGMLDESETETIPGAIVVPVPKGEEVRAIPSSSASSGTPPPPAALDKAMLARKARIDKLKNEYGDLFPIWASDTLGRELPPRLSMLTVEDIEKLEAKSEAEGLYGNQIPDDRDHSFAG